jgi:branched-chain amino acid transport system ATP-binding protein
MLPDVEEQPSAVGREMLAADGLSSGYGHTVILNDISVRVGATEIVAIIGRNGVGKSTLMKTLMGLVPAKSGGIRFADEVITTLPAHLRARRGIGYIPQGRGIFPGLSVEENLVMGELIHADGAEKSLQIAFDYFPRLGERRKQRAGTLSGGEQSMLAIGRVLVGRPRLMLLDEPSEGIQPSIVHQIGEDILRINRELGVPVLFVEQNIELIRHVATRGYVMDKGTIVAQLARDEIRDQDAITRFLTV